MPKEVVLGRLRTKGKSLQEIQQEQGEYSAEYEDLLHIQKAYEAFDGAEVYLAPSIFGEKPCYCLIRWDKKYDSKMKKAMYHLEQDSLCGNYLHNREGFNEDWESGEYSPCAIVAFAEKEVEVLNVIGEGEMEDGKKKN